ncbi:MAG TPA: lysophospholipid acyltransferase family protein [Nocardioides sp.]|nr:lysophospholipid acyltransferase family protein [Nocardioides sp.]
MTVRKMQEKRGWAFWLAVSIVKPVLLCFTRRTWVHMERIPLRGGFVVALNHISHADPLTAAHLLYDSGRLPRYLAKAGLWKIGWLRLVMDGAGQIPVERDSRGADAYAAAVRAIGDGKAIVVYPEATITRDPDMWPMKGKSGAARIALETGCPVIPVGQWGAHELLPPYTKRPRLLPRRRIVMRVGEPVQLEDLRGRQQTPEVVAEASERIMAAITRELEQIRGEKAPQHRWDMKVDGDRFAKAKSGEKK